MVQLQVGNNLLEAMVMSGAVDVLFATLVGWSSFRIPSGRSDMVSTITLPLMSSLASECQVAW